LRRLYNAIYYILNLHTDTIGNILFLENFFFFTKEKFPKTENFINQTTIKNVQNK